MKAARDGFRRWRAEIAIVALGVILAAATIANTSPTADEEKHIWNGFSYQIKGRGIHDETPSARLHAILLDRDLVPRSPIVDHDRRVESLWDDREDAFRILILSRVFTAVAFLVLLVVFASWAHALFPPMTARVVLALAASSPTLLAHASVATSDMFLTACAFAACHALFRYQRAPSTKRAAAVGVWAGLAVLAKISGVFLYGTIVLAFVWLVIRNAPADRRGTRARRVALVIVVPVLVLNVGYGFQRTLRPMNDYTLHSHVLQRVAASAVGAVPLPIPAGFVQAIDYSLADRYRRLEVNQMPAYMLGEMYIGTRLSYFPFAFAVKTSGVILLLLGLGLWATRKQRPAGVFLGLGVFPIVFFLTNVFMNSFDIGVRYILPIYPFVIMCGGFGIMRGLGARIAVPAVLVQLVWTGIAFPNYLASFNLVSWFAPKASLLSDSNLDWGQMNHLVTADLEDHPTTAPVRICTIAPVVGESHRREYKCPTMAQDGRFYVSTTIERLGRFNLTRYLRRPSIRTLAEVIEVHEVAAEADFTVSFVNDWEVSAPFSAPSDPLGNLDWMSRDREPFSPAQTRFGLLDIRALHGNVAMPKTCVLARSTRLLVGEVLLGADDTLYAYDRGAIIAHDRLSSNVDWPQTIVAFEQPAHLRFMLCNVRGDFAVQAAVR